jgi:hypothetical protein
MKRFSVFIIITLFSFLPEVEAQIRKPKGVVLPDELVASAVDGRGGEVDCGRISDKWIPGVFDENTQVFLSDIKNIEYLQKRLKIASIRMRSKVRRQLLKARSLYKIRRAACMLLPDPDPGEPRSIPSPTPEEQPQPLPLPSQTPVAPSPVGTIMPPSSNTPLPTATPTSTPISTSTPSVKVTYIDSSGAVTSAGRSFFKIPTGLAGTVATGSIVYKDKCMRCHDGSSLSAPSITTFTAYRTATSRSPMFFTTTLLPDTDLSHLTVYLNRSRTQSP